MLSGVVRSAQNPKIFFTANLVAMTNSFHEDDSLNGYRTALPIDITHSLGFMVAQTSVSSPFDMAGSDLRPRPIMTTAYVLRAPRTDRKPGDVLEALKTAQATTRSPAYVWWPQDGLVPHARHNAPIPKLVGDYSTLFTKKRRFN
jgi:hypothetical protein